MGINEPGRPPVRSKRGVRRRLGVYRTGGHGRAVRPGIRLPQHGIGKLTEIGVEVVVFSPEGELKGFFDLPVDAPMEPGGTGYLVYEASRVAEGKIDASEGYRIVLLPCSASGPRERWQAAQGALRRARAALKAARGDASLAKDQESSGDDRVGSPTP